ncbi:MAG: type II toxin-antitoxin system antitoxin SocA domain-containing protein [Alphaproteobacteria bacterium]
MTALLGLKGKYETPSEVANFFLEKSKKDGIPVTPLKLIKLIFLAYGWALGAENIKLFDEKIEAWKYGPVIPSIYHEFKHFGGDPIVDFSSQRYDPFDDKDAYAPQIPKKDTTILDVLDLVWDLYKDKSATALMRLTHEKDAPWDKVWSKHKFENHEISTESIRGYYKDLMDKLVKSDVA